MRGANERWIQPVDRQAGPPFPVAVAAHRLGPLLAQPGEPQVVQRLAPVLGLRIRRSGERRTGLFENLFVGQGIAPWQRARTREPGG